MSAQSQTPLAAASSGNTLALAAYVALSAVAVFLAATMKCVGDVLNILMQAGNSMLAQANQLPQNVLQLLR